MREAWGKAQEGIFKTLPAFLLLLSYVFRFTHYASRITFLS